MVEVGKTEKRTVSELNHELYTAGINIMDEAYKEHRERCWHMGRADLGDFIDWLEANYEIKKKAP